MAAQRAPITRIVRTGLRLRRTRILILEPGGSAPGRYRPWRLPNRMGLVDRQSYQSLLLPVRPADLYPIDFRAGAQTELQERLAGARKTVAGLHGGAVAEITCVESGLGADRIPAGRPGQQAQAQPVLRRMVV